MSTNTAEAVRDLGTIAAVLVVARLAAWHLLPGDALHSKALETAVAAAALFGVLCDDLEMSDGERLAMMQIVAAKVSSGKLSLSFQRN